MEIAAIAKQNLESISQLFISVFNNSPWNEHWEYSWAYERLNWIYEAQGFMGFSIADGDRIVGAILGHFVPFQGKEGFEIVEFFVKTNYQNQGIGTKLLLRLESGLKQRNCDFIVLLTGRNTEAESFYRKHNYKPDDRLVLLRKKIN